MWLPFVSKNTCDKGRTLHPLEIAAMECMAVSQQAPSIWQSLAAHNCALRIRQLPGWQMYLPIHDNEHT